jgi:RHS repeat-associated protein
LHQGQGSGLSVADGLLAEVLVVPNAGWLIGDRQWRDREQTLRANPEAVYARRASRMAYEHLDSRAAAEVARQTFPQAVNRLAGGPPQLPAGQRIVRYLNGNIAQIDAGGGKHAVVESTQPFATRTSSGNWAPVNLSLTQSSTGFAPTSSAVPVSIPKQLSRGLQLGETGVSLTPVNTAGAVLGGSQGMVDGSVVIYANTQMDADTAVKPTQLGFETFTLLRSIASPQQLSFRVGMPAGARLVETRGSSGGALVISHGKPLAAIPTPSALDAEGLPVPVSLSVSSDILTLEVKHSSGAYRYPIAVDPVLIDSQLSNIESPHLALTNWEGETNKPTVFEIEQLLTHWTTSTIFTFKTGDYAQVIYKTQGESQIYKFVSTTEVATSSSNGVKSELTIGKVGSTEAKLELPFKYTSAAHTLCINSCNPPASPQHNNANFINTAVKEGNEFFEASLTAAEISVTQTKGPAVSWDTTDPTINGTPNALYNNKWANQSAIIELKASDPGLGVSEFAFKWVGHSEAEWGMKKVYIHPNATEAGRCYGIQCEPCIGIQCPSVHTDDSTTPFKLAEGEDTIEATVYDPLNLSASSTHTVKYDNAAPHDIAITGLPASHEIGEGQYQLKIKAVATDGSGSTLSSGIASIVMSIDGEQVGNPSVGCTPGPCVSGHEWTINAEDYGAGAHTLAVTATDNAGNTAKEELTITLHHAEPIAAGPGKVNPVTGELTLEGSDVGIPAAGGSLFVSRSYSSRHLTAGAEGALGPQWIMNIGPQESLTKSPSGNVVLEGTDGRLTTFVNKGSGKYSAPAGDANMTLIEETVGGSPQFVLTNDGASTTFAIPVGGNGTLWKPTIAQGAGGTNAITYASQTVGGVTEPTEELAPVPVGVSCAPELKKGCRALTFNYAASTTASSENPSGWGDYIGHLTRVYFTAWDPAKNEMTTTAVSQYAYDTQGRLRTQWDPRISPALKVKYGYDVEGHVTAIAPPGQQPWLFAYGVNAEDPGTWRLVSVSRPGSTTALGEGVAPSNSAAPTLSTSSPSIGKSLSVTNGTWSNSPLAYSYQWRQCNSAGSNCVPIYGARNSTYTPTIADAGYTLVAQVTAVNAGGSVLASTTASSAVSAIAPVVSLQFGSSGTGNGQFKLPMSAATDASGNLWVTDYSNNRIEEFSATGTFIKAYGSEGTENGKFKGPWGIAVDQGSANVYVSDAANCRIQELSSSGTFIRAFGSCGTGSGQLSSTPAGVKIDREGNVWVADSTNNRLEVFTSTGAYMRTIGSEGTGNGQFKAPRDIAFFGENVYVTDMSNNRVEEFSLEGAYVGQFGSSGTGNGQFKTPLAVAADPITGELYVADSGNNRVEEFNPAGAYLTTFGSLGSGEGQMSAPSGITVTSSGGIYVVDKSNNRVQLWAPKLSTSYAAQFGSLGAGNGQFKGPSHVALDAHGNVWATDTSNQRVEEFSPTGTFIASYGSSGSEGLHFSYPTGIAINQTTGNIYVSDEGNGRIVEFTTGGAFVREIGKEGVANGELKFPDGLMLDGSGNLWVADGGNNRVQEFNSVGGFLRAFGTTGTGNGQFKFPADLTLSGGYIYVVDDENNRVQKFTTGGTYEGQFGSVGSGNGQFESPSGIATEPTTGDLYVADTSNFRIQVFTSKGTFIESIGSFGSGNGQFSKPVGMTFTPAAGLYVADFNNNRVQKFATGYTKAEAPVPPSTGTTAVTTIAYKVPISGVGAPYSMGASDVSAWAQTDTPAEATAVFPPDEPQGTPVSDYRRATIYYLDGADRTVNVASPAGGISTVEYNSYNDVVRSLSASNREVALKEGAKSAEVSQLLDTQSTYSNEGTEMTSTLGPRHTVKLANGSEVLAREHTQYYYDEGAPSESETYRLLTKSTTGAQITGEPEADVHTTVTGYDGQNNLGWILRKPTSKTVDPSGLKLVETTIYDPITGNVIESRSPGAGAASEENSGTFVAVYGKLGSGNLEYSKPGAIATDKSNNIWVADTENNRIEEISSAGAFVRVFGTVGTGNGQLKKPEGIAVDSSNKVWVADTGNNRIQQFSSTGTYINQFGSLGSGTSQFSSPTGIAMKGTEGIIYVADRGNNRIQVIIAGEGGYLPWFRFGTSGSGNGQLSAPEGVTVDASGNAWVADTGNNRVEEFDSSGAYVRKFGSVGSGNGQLSKPEGLTLDSASNIWVADGGNGRIQGFSPSGVYQGKFGSSGSGEHQFSTPAAVALGASKNLDVIDTGNSRVQVWTPPSLAHEATGNGGTHGVQTIYYSVAANAKYTNCGEHPEWANMVCQTQPAAQPETAGIPNLPVSTMTYNIWNEPLVSKSTIGAATRTSTSGYDGVGRLVSTEITSTVGTALPVVKYEYSSETGTRVKISTVVEGKTKTITSVFNTLGQLASYTDADENTSTYNYDIDGRTEKSNDGKSTQTLTYNSTSGALTTLVDSAAGTFTATYGGAGQLLSAGYPNGMSANYTYNAAGESTGLEYVKTTHCSSNCTWYSDSVTRSIAGAVLRQASSLSSQNYTYDNAGRLTQVQDTPTGQGCTTRIYVNDIETNRTSLTTRSPGVGGVCASEGGTAENHGYDTANRLTDSGIAYDTFGDVTKLPAADAGGSEVTSTYYVNSALASQTQKGQTIGYNLDGLGRPRVTVYTGTVNSTVTSHYSGVGNYPAWTATSTGKWTHNIRGLVGGLAAVQNEGEEPVLQLANLHGDIVATASLSETATSLASTSDTSEYGVPRTSTPPKYSWLGGAGSATDLPSGIIAMGARSYVPQLGRFLQTDPSGGGSANAYTYTFGDPVNTSDVSGEHTWAGETNENEEYGAQVAAEMVATEAAREAAARAEAEVKIVDPNEEIYYHRKRHIEFIARRLIALADAGNAAGIVGLFGEEAEDTTMFGMIIGQFTSEQITKWFEQTAGLLEECASRMVPHGLRHEVQYCHMSMPVFEMSVFGHTVFRSHIPNFYLEPTMSYCVSFMYAPKVRLHGCEPVHYQWVDPKLLV